MSGLTGPVAIVGQVVGQDGSGRKVKSQVAPSYPDLARKMHIAGVVKVEVTIAPNGSVKNVKLVGGHPLLVDSVMESVRKWRYEPAKDETTKVVEIHFGLSE